MNWDLIITILIIGGLFLAIIAKASNQTVPEVIQNIVDIFRDKAEETADGVQNIVYE